MSYKGRALYNLIQMNLKENPHLEFESWQVENYRKLSLEKLFALLQSHQISLDKRSFLLYVEESDSPEDLADSLYLGKDFVTHEKVFLCVFELWRRLCPHKQSLSLFCDELDHLIEEYEDGNLKREEELQAELLSLGRILDDNVDEGGDPLEGVELLFHFSCHDLEVFIYEYIAHQIELGNILYASELLEGFYPYAKNRQWFDFLKTREIISTNFKEGIMMLERFLESLREKPDIHLLFEVLHFLVCLGESRQFFIAFNQVLEALKTEEELRELMNISCDYFNCNEREQEEQTILDLLEKRKGKNLQDPVDSEDSSLRTLRELVIYSPA